MAQIPTPWREVFGGRYFRHLLACLWRCMFLFVLGGVGVCFLMFCRSLVATPNSLNQARFPHMSSPTMCLVFLFPFSASFSFYFCFFSEYIYRWYGCYFWCFFFLFFLLDLSFFLACFQMGFYFVTTGWIFEISLCLNSINQSKSYKAHFRFRLP